MAPLLNIADTEGDAIFAYAQASSILRPEVLLEVAEDFYFEFRRRLELMRSNTTCKCSACVNMNNLDLKVFIHFGEYMSQLLGGGLQLQGADVILVLRLMKNRVTDDLGMNGYLMVTEAALSRIGDDSLRQRLVPHSESHEHLGDVQVWLHDLRAHWSVERAERRPKLDLSKAWACASIEVPIFPWIAWDYATHRDTKRDYFDLISFSRRKSLPPRRWPPTQNGS